MFPRIIFTSVIYSSSIQMMLSDQIYQSVKESKLLCQGGCRCRRYCQH
ncbi:hypothetical protein Gohar_002336 [Gossypium harknessii]|uniref:Uncharacterized protein n=1 Tax=Gossypium harknessii TaxID=34285 RepID=A0A7J9HKL4_9ROSI|nr:hypothetical protein [Gossypium harknessii]